MVRVGFILPAKTRLLRKILCLEDFYRSPKIAIIISQAALLPWPPKLGKKRQLHVQSSFRSEMEIKFAVGRRSTGKLMRFRSRIFHNILVNSENEV